MSMPKIFKSKIFYITLVLVALGGYWFWQNAQKAKQITYETAEVEQRRLLQTVEVTGEIKPAARIDLAFKTGGTLQKVYVKTGDQVKAGDVLAELEADDLYFAQQRAQAMVAMAGANLNARLAGESEQSIKMGEAQLEQAEAAYSKALSDLENTKVQVQNDLQSALIALETAKNNYDNSLPITDQSLKNAVESARVSLKTTVGPMNTALVDGDSVAGVDDTNSSKMYASALGILNEGSMTTAQNSYRKAKALKIEAEKAIELLSSDSSKQTVLDAADKTEAAIGAIQIFLLDVKTVLAASITTPEFSASALTAKKSAIDADYVQVSSQKSSVVAARQALDMAELNNTSDKTKLADALRAAEVAYDIAKTNVDLRIAAAETNVDIQKAAVSSAQAALDLKVAGPRAVDVAPLRAQLQEANVSLAQAENNLNNVRILAPVDGTITDVISDVGEQITPNVAQIRMIGTEVYDIEAQVPEADIVKVQVGQEAEITLDAYGDEIKFKGVVTAENPDQTKVLDAIYYKIRVALEKTDRDIKPGMTANVIVTTNVADNAFVIPVRAVKTDAETGAKSVRILVDNQPETKQIELGLRGDEGRVQVLHGLSVGQAVILSEKIGK